MSDDIFREVEEEVRRERLEKLWKDYGDYITAAASLLILGAAGFQLWRVYEARETAKASNQYILAMQMMENGQSQAAARAFARLSKDSPRGYSHLSELQSADALLAAGNRDEAVAIYRRIVSSGDEMLGAIARIRAAWATVDNSPRSDIESLLGPLTVPTNAWHPMAREILAYADYRTGAIGKARAEFEQLAKDPAASAGVKQRAQAMATFIGAGGDNDVGEVPAPVPKPAGAGATASNNSSTAPNVKPSSTNPQGQSPK